MALSNAPAAKRALYDALKASSALAGVGVWYSTPNTDRPPNENLIVGPDDTPLRVAQSWATIGAGATRDEGIDIPVVIDVLIGGTDEFAAEARAWELGEAVAAVLAARPFAAAVFEAHPDGFEQTTTAYQDGRYARLSFVVHCQGRVGGI